MEQRIINLFFEQMNKVFSVREISRELKLPVSSVSRHVKRLLEKKLIVCEQKGNLYNLKASKNDSFFREKRISNLKQIFDSRLVDFLIKEYNYPACIVLFGSYSLGEDFSNSDIDICVVTKEKKNVDLSKFEKKLKKEIQLLEIDFKKNSKELINNISNGIVLYGKWKIF